MECCAVFYRGKVVATHLPGIQDFVQMHIDRDGCQTLNGPLSNCFHKTLLTVKWKRSDPLKPSSWFNMNTQRYKMM